MKKKLKFLLLTCMMVFLFGSISVYAAHLKGQQYYDSFDYKTGSAFLIGNEGNGLKESTADLADTYVKIPMAGQVESLNAAIATTLFMYEAARQRGF